MFDLVKTQQEVAEISANCVSIADAIERFDIKGPTDYDDSLQFVKRIRTQYKVVDDFEKSITKPLLGVIKIIRDLSRPPKAILDDAEGSLKHKRGVWTREQERIRADQQAKLDAQARKARERKLEQARKAEEAGRAERAAALIQQAQVVVAPVIQSAAPKQAGTYMLEVWHARVVDADLIPNDYKIIDDPKIQKVAKATKGSITIPGVEFYSTQEERIRR